MIIVSGIPSIIWLRPRSLMSSESEPTASSGDWALERLSSGLCVPRTPSLLITCDAHRALNDRDTVPGSLATHSVVDRKGPAHAPNDATGETRVNRKAR